jgi:hypothetical protein
MKALLCIVVGSVVLVAAPALAAVSCTGVLEYDDGAFAGRFHCRYQGPVLRRVLATCHDGEVGCDADAACNGACTFAVCTDSACNDTFGVTVPLRPGKAKGRAVVRTARARMILRCLPPRGLCGPLVSTTTTSTTTTTLPARPCRATLSGAVSGMVDCTASFSVGGLGLPTLVLRLDGDAAAGQAALLMTSSAPGTYHLGQGVVLAVLALSRPDPAAFQATQPRDSQSADVTLDAVSPSGTERSFRVHGTLAATLAGALSGDTVRLEAEF